MSAPNTVTFRQVLRNRQFLALWLAQLVSSFGDWLAILAIFSLITFRWHGTPADVAGIFLSFASPFALLGPLAGVYVDRWDLKRTMIASDLLRAVLAGLLVFATEFWQVYALLFALSAVSCFFLPAQTAMIRLLVQPQELLVANAINAQTIHLSKIIGPAAAGLIVAWAGEKPCFLLDAVSFVISAAFLFSIAAQRAPAAAAKGVAAVFRDLREGLAFLWGHRALRFVLVATVAMIFVIGAFDALVAVYVRDVVGGQSQVFGALVAIIGVGTILGGLGVGKLGQSWPRVKLILTGMLGLGVGIGLLALSSTAVPAVLASLLLGVAVSAVIIPSQTLTQEETPQEMLGRVSSTSISIITVSQLGAVAVSGKLAEWTGIRNLYYLLAAALTLMAVFGFAYARNSGLFAARVPASTPAEPAPPS